MNGPQHYRTAETLLENLRRELPSGAPLHVPAQQTRMIDEAQVHATLALVAATMNAANVSHYTSRDGESYTGPMDLNPSEGTTWDEVL